MVCSDGIIEVKKSPLAACDLMKIIDKVLKVWSTNIYIHI